MSLFITISGVLKTLVNLISSVNDYFMQQKKLNLIRVKLFIIFYYDLVYELITPIQRVSYSVILRLQVHFYFQNQSPVHLF
jgi:hypothetical protein